MKRTKEFEGKNIDQAIENACSELNLARKNLKYDVISSGSSGIFGIVGVKKARIRVDISGSSNEQSENKNNINSDDVNGVMSIVDEAFGEKKNTRPSIKKNKPVNRNNKKTAQVKHNIKHDEMDTIPAVRPAASVPSVVSDSDISDLEYNADNKNLHKKYEPARETKKEPVESSKDFYEEDDKSVNPETSEHKDSIWDEGFPPIYKDEVPVDVSEESVVLGRETLQKMVDFITSGAKVVAETNGDKLLLRIEGGNSGVLIGRRGQTLEAMQFLTDKIINRQSESRVRLKVDIEGYMETRKANLKSLAYKMANKAKKTGRPATINQMTAQDRRIVHLALKDDARVRTQSMGDGYYRRLVIFPKKTSYRKNNHTRKK